MPHLPQIIVIGSMKSGTSSLCDDLAQHSDVYLISDDKEPSYLAQIDCSTEETLSKYAKLYQHASENQKCIDGSTVYTRLPHVPGVAEYARKILPESAKFLYIVRHPVDRAISHYNHNIVKAFTDTPLPKMANEDLPRDLFDISRYAMQLKPWIECFGLERIKVMTFEQFIKSRQACLDEICEFFDLSPMPEVDTSVVKNPTEGRLMTNRSILRPLLDQPFYRNNIRPLLPGKLRDNLKSKLVPKAGKPQPPRPDQLDYFINELRDEPRALADLLGHDQPFWDIEDIRQKYSN